MKVLTFTLVMDGSSDRILKPIIEWLLDKKLGQYPYNVQFARGLPPFRNGLSSRIKHAHAMYPSDILLIHRDSEKEPWDSRMEEIRQAVEQACISDWLPIVPVRMSEAWFLSDEKAIRRAAGNSSSKPRLNLPQKAQWSSEPDPKEVLFEAIRTASGYSGRKLQKLDLNAARVRVADLVEDFGYLRGIESFDHFEASLDAALATMKRI